MSIGPRTAPSVGSPLRVQSTTAISLMPFCSPRDLSPLGAHTARTRSIVILSPILRRVGGGDPGRVRHLPALNIRTGEEHTMRVKVLPDHRRRIFMPGIVRSLLAELSPNGALSRQLRNDEGRGARESRTNTPVESGTSAERDERIRLRLPDIGQAKGRMSFGKGADRKA